MEYTLKEIQVGFHKSLFYILENGKSLTKAQISKIYKPLGTYPFVDSGWAHYHLNQLKTKIELAAIGH